MKRYSALLFVLFATPLAADPPPRSDIHISGVYPHLTTYGVYSQDMIFGNSVNPLGMAALGMAPLSKPCSLPIPT